MFSRRLTSCLYLAFAALLFALLVQTTSAAPAPVPEPEPEPTSPSLGEVVSKNRNMACSAGACYYKNATTTQDSTESSSNSTDSTSSGESGANGASTLSDIRITWPVMMIAGTSLLFIL